MLSLEHRFLKLDWTNRYFLPDKSFLEPWGVWGGEGRTEPLLWGKPRVTRFPPGGRTLLGPAASASPLLRLLLVRRGWRCLASLQAPQRSGAAKEKQKGRRVAAGRRDRLSPCRGRRGRGGFLWAGWVTPTTALGLSGGALDHQRSSGEPHVHRGMLGWRTFLIVYSEGWM